MKVLYAQTGAASGTEVRIISNTLVTQKCHVDIEFDIVRS